MFKKIIETLKGVNKILLRISNFILVFFIYWIGAGLSFLVWKAFNLRKKKTEKKTYWLEYEREEEDYHRQF